MSSFSRLARSVGRPLIRAAGTVTAGGRDLPDFLVIGGKRCGSTSLYYGLLQHPSVVPQFPGKGLVPVRDNRKGVHYFDHEYGRSERWYRSHFPHDRQRRRTIAQTGAAVSGEATPWYLFAPGAAERAAAVAPDAKLIAILRDPVDRAHSHFLEQRRRGHEPLDDFAAALDAEEERCVSGVTDARGTVRSAAFAHEHLTYTLQGEYDDGLEPWLERWPRDRVLVLRSEDFFTDAPAVLAAATEFLGLPAHPFASEQRNASSGARPDDAARSRLAVHYAPRVERLEAMLGRSMGWSVPGSSR
jgi:hypothetical protein